MGMMAELITVVRSYIANRNKGPGQTVCIEGIGIGKAGLNAVIFSAPGVFSRPPKGTRGIAVPIGREKIVIAMHNYQVVIDWTDDGETTIFSTTADGKTVKARIDLKADGNIYLNGTSKYLTTWGALKNALDTLVSNLNSHTHMVASLGAPTGPASASTPPITFACDISDAKASTLRTDG